MTIELNDYGFELDTYVCYIALSWQVLIPALIALVCYKAYKKIKSNKVSPITLEDNDDWMTK